MQWVDTYIVKYVCPLLRCKCVQVMKNVAGHEQPWNIEIHEQQVLESGWRKPPILHPLWPWCLHGWTISLGSWGPRLWALSYLEDLDVHFIHFLLQRSNNHNIGWLFFFFKYAPWLAKSCLVGSKQDNEYVSQWNACWVLIPPPLRIYSFCTK